MDTGSRDEESSGYGPKNSSSTSSTFLAPSNRVRCNFRWSSFITRILHPGSCINCNPRPTCTHRPSQRATLRRLVASPSWSFHKAPLIDSRLTVDIADSIDVSFFHLALSNGSSDIDSSAYAWLWLPALSMLDIGAAATAIHMLVSGFERSTAVAASLMMAILIGHFFCWWTLQPRYSTKECILTSGSIRPWV